MVEEIVTAIDNVAGSFTGALVSGMVNRFLDTKNKRFQRNTQKLIELADKEIAGLPPEKISEPDGRLILLLLQLNCVTDDELLRGYFAKLLASSMKIETQTVAHISFANILSQLSPAEALLMKSTSVLRDNNPVARISYQKRADRDEQHVGIYGKDYKGQTFADNDLFFEFFKGEVMLSHVTLFDRDLPPKQMSFLLANLMRLNLIEVNYNLQVEAENYKGFKRTELFDEFEQEIKFKGKMKADFHLVYNAGVILPTEYGRAFYKVCVK